MTSGWILVLFVIILFAIFVLYYDYFIIHHDIIARRDREAAENPDDPENRLYMLERGLYTQRGPVRRDEMAEFSKQYRRMAEKHNAKKKCSNHISLDCPICKGSGWEPDFEKMRYVLDKAVPKKALQKKFWGYTI